jgi:hypothetical protein
MVKKKPQIPAELAAFIEDDHTTFHCDDGDWDLKIESREDSDFSDELPPRSMVIAENGSGDCLFLKTSAAGKTDAKVYVYWHEENRDEVFAKSLKELTAASNKNKAAASKKESKPAPAPTKKVNLKEVEKAMQSNDAGKRMKARQEFRDSAYSVEALPMLRRLLASDDVSTVIFAAECIATLGPEAAACPAGESSDLIAKPASYTGDLFEQLMSRGAQVWSYSGLANCYSACLDALAKLEYDPDDLIDYVRTHIGMDAEFLEDSLLALKSIGTPEARDLAKRALAFWQPDLNMSQTKKAKAIVESIGAKKKK